MTRDKQSTAIRGLRESSKDKNSQLAGARRRSKGTRPKHSSAHPSPEAIEKNCFMSGQANLQLPEFPIIQQILSHICSLRVGAIGASFPLKFTLGNRIRLPAVSKFPTFGFEYGTDARQLRVPVKKDRNFPPARRRSVSKWLTNLAKPRAIFHFYGKVLS